MSWPPYVVENSDGTSSCCYRIVHRGVPCVHCPEFASVFEKRPKPTEAEAK